MERDKPSLTQISGTEILGCQPFKFLSNLIKKACSNIKEVFKGQIKKKKKKANPSIGSSSE